MSGVIPGSPEQLSNEWLTSALREDGVIARAFFMPILLISMLERAPVVTGLRPCSTLGCASRIHLREHADCRLARHADTISTAM